MSTTSWSNVSKMVDRTTGHQSTNKDHQSEYSVKTISWAEMLTNLLVDVQRRYVDKFSFSDFKLVPDTRGPHRL